MRGCQQNNQSNFGDNLTTQVLARVEQAFAKVQTVIEQAFAKVETAISKRVAASATAPASSPRPPTSTQEFSKILIHAEIIQTNGDRAANE